MSERQCISCKWCGKYRADYGENYTRCNRPNEVTGFPFTDKFIDIERRYSRDSCGPEGKYWQPKEEPKNERIDQSPSEDTNAGILGSRLLGALRSLGRHLGLPVR